MEEHLMNFLALLVFGIMVFLGGIGAIVKHVIYGKAEANVYHRTKKEKFMEVAEPSV